MEIPQHFRVQEGKITRVRTLNNAIWALSRVSAAVRVGSGSDVGAGRVCRGKNRGVVRRGGVSRNSEHTDAALRAGELRRRLRRSGGSTEGVRKHRGGKGEVERMEGETLPQRGRNSRQRDTAGSRVD